MDKKLRVLLVGAAFSADLHVDAYSRIWDQVEIVAIVDKNQQRIEDLAKRYRITGYQAYDDYTKAIAEVECDLVDICMPNFLHFDVGMKALERGRDILCEKPLATTVEDAQTLVDTAQKHNKHIYYAEDWLGSPAVNKALAIIEQGGIGDVLYIRARECHSGSHSPFAQTIEYCGGGCMVHLGIHPICFVLALKNNRWKELVALTSGGKEQNLIHKQMEGEDWAGALIRFEDGTTACLEANYVTTGGMEDVIDFYGTKGCLHLDLTFSSAIRAVFGKRAGLHGGKSRGHQRLVQPGGG